VIFVGDFVDRDPSGLLSHRLRNYGRCGARLRDPRRGTTEIASQNLA
jgi:hypothetical protein